MLCSGGIVDGGKKTDCSFKEAETSKGSAKAAKWSTRMAFRWVGVGRLEVSICDRISEVAECPCILLDPSSLNMAMAQASGNGYNW